MSWQRFLPPVLFFPFLAYTVFSAPPVFFTVLVGVIVILGLLEFYNMVEKEDWWFLGLFSGIILVGSAHYGYSSPFWLSFFSVAKIGGTITGVVFLILLLGLIREVVSAISRFSLFAIIFGLLYIGWLTSHLILIKNLEAGEAKLLYLFAVVWTADGCAYLVGKRFGRHRNIFSQSPNKSVEGLIGSIVGSILVSILLRECVGFSLFCSAVMGAVLALFALFGDLVESSFKRNVGVKDSDSWIAEYGGILDVFDSIIVSAPVFYYILIFFD
jgi:phosphatidate cytidylyltransferase